MSPILQLFFLRETRFYWENREVDSTKKLKLRQKSYFPPHQMHTKDLTIGASHLFSQRKKILQINDEGKEILASEYVFFRSFHKENLLIDLNWIRQSNWTIKIPFFFHILVFRIKELKKYWRKKQFELFVWLKPFRRALNC